MPLTASFAADFQKFTRSIEGAQVTLRVFERETKNAARGLNRELESISGQKVAAEAARMAEAVRRLGGEGGTAAGLLKLTDAELQRVTASMEAATLKAGRLGEELPDSLKQINAEIAKLPKPVEDASKGVGFLDASFAKMTASFTAAGVIDRVVGGVVSFGTAAIQSAGNLVDLNASTRVSIETLQRWSQVAKLGGIQLEDMTSASFRLNAAIDGGGRSVREAVARLGGEFERLRTLAPEQQMDEILRAAGALGDSQDRNAVLVELFGIRGAQALARIVDGYADTATAANVATDEQIRALDRAADRWDKFIDDLGTGFKAAMGRVVSELENLDDAAGGLNRQGFIGGGEFDPLLAQMDDLRQAEERRAAGRKEDIQLSVEASKAARDYATELAKMQRSIDDLTGAQRVQLDAALKIGASAEDITRQFGLSEDVQRLYASAVKDTAQSLESADDATARFNDSIAKNREETKKATEELQRFITTTNSKTMAAGDTFGDMAKLLEDRFTGPTARALLSNVKAYQQYQQDLRVLTERETLGRVDFEIAQIQRWAREQKAALDTTAGTFKENAALIDELANKKIDKVITDDAIAQMILFANLNTEATKRAKELARATRQETANAMRELASTFATLAQATGQEGGFLGNVAEIIGLMSVGATAGDQFRTALDKMGETNKVTAAGLLQMASAAAAAIAALEKATDRAGSAQRALAGASVGAQIGANFGPKGAAIGAGIGALVGILRKPAFEDVMKRVGRDWGVAISEELARGIADEAKKLFGGNRQAAELFSLDKIIAEGGGLNASNLDKMTSKLRDVFSLVQTGAFTSAQAVEVLDENFADFVEVGTDAAGRLAPSLTEIIRLTRELGVASQEVQGYMRSQAETALSGVNAIINASKGQFDAWEDIADKVKEAQADVDKLNHVDARGRGTEWVKEMQTAQEALTKALGDQFKAGELAAGELENLGRIAMGTYAAAIEAGMSHNEALRAAAPGLSQIVKAYEHLGLSAEDAGLKAFLAQAKFVEANPELLAGIDGLAQSFIALSNIGLLNAETFNQMQEAGGRMYQRLLEQASKFGLEGDEASRAALLPMQDFLREAAKQAELLGIPLDENTAKLIEQSKALGIWKDKSLKPGEEMVDVMREIRDAVNELSDALRGIPSKITTDVTTRYRTEGTPPGGSGGGSGDGSGPTQPPSVSSATNSGVGQNVTIRVPVVIDGRQVAVAVVPNLAAAMRQRGA